MGQRRAVVMVLAVALALGATAACKRKPSAEKDMMNRLAGKWEWKEGSKTAQAPVITLDLTAKGRYEQRIYREVGGKLRLLYMRINPVDIAVEPDNPDELARLKRERYEPSIETGRHGVKLQGPMQTLIFESDRISAVDRTAGRTSREESFSFAPGEKLIIGGRTFVKQ